MRRGTDCSVRARCRQVDARSTASSRTPASAAAVALSRCVRGGAAEGGCGMAVAVVGASGAAAAPAPTAASTRSTPRSGGTHTPCHIPEEGVIPLRCSLNWCRHCGVRADEMVAIQAGWSVAAAAGGGGRGAASGVVGAGRGSGEDASGFGRKRSLCRSTADASSWPPKHSRSASWTGARR